MELMKLPSHCTITMIYHVQRFFVLTPTVVVRPAAMNHMQLLRRTGSTGNVPRGIITESWRRRRKCGLDQRKQLKVIIHVNVVTSFLLHVPTLSECTLYTDLYMIHSFMYPQPSHSLPGNQYPPQEHPPPTKIPRLDTPHILPHQYTGARVQEPICQGT